MKRIFAILFVIAAILNAQPFQVNYSVIIENCDGSDYYEIFSGSISEGESFNFPPVTLPSEYSSAQFLYNIFSGGEFGIAEGSLNENIDLTLNLGAFWCDLSIVENPEGVMRLFSLFVQITGENSGYNPNLYYWFNNNKEAYIKIPKDHIAFYAILLGIFDLNKISVFYVGDNSIDLNAIRKEVTATDFIIYPQHFSLLSAGIVNSSVGVIAETQIPEIFNLSQNYPNPFNPDTKINYSLPVESNVKLSVFNSLGEEVKNLVNEKQNAGNFEINFNANSLSSGIYFYKITTERFSKINKMILLK